MRILADSNILARTAQITHRQNRSATESVEALLSRHHDVCIVPQVVYEFWVVATRPASANGLDLTVPEAGAELAKARRIFTWLLDERAIFPIWAELVRDYAVKGKNAHDARLVAAMHRHDLKTILTFNQADFSRYPNIAVLTPGMVLAEGFTL